MNDYVAYLDVGDVRIDALDDLTALLSELAVVRIAPGGSVRTEAGTVPTRLALIYSVGTGGSAEDLWDLRETLDGVNTQVAEYTSNRIEKPTPVVMS